MNYIYIPELVDLRKSFRVFNSANVHSHISEHADVFLIKKDATEDLLAEIVRIFILGNFGYLFLRKFGN